MVSLVQILTLFFVLFSLLLVIAIPVLFASGDEWEKSKGTVSSLATLWSGLVFATGIANSFL